MGLRYVHVVCALSTLLTEEQGDVREGQASENPFAVEYQSAGPQPGTAANLVNRTSPLWHTVGCNSAEMGSEMGTVMESCR